MELAWVDVLGGEVYVIHMVVLVGRERVDLWAGKRGVLWRSVKDDEVVPRRYVQDSSIVLSSLVPELMIILLLPTRRLFRAGVRRILLLRSVVYLHLPPTQSARTSVHHVCTQG
jgi:hypothetical protein